MVTAFVINFSSMEEMKRDTGYVETQVLPLFLAVEENPYDWNVWREVVQLAWSEDYTVRDYTSVYFNIPSVELAKIGERIRRLKTLDEKYRILSERCSNGMLWYDIILQGNQKGIKVLAKTIGRRRWSQGLDMGCGTGNSIRSIAGYCESIYGLDIFPFLLGVAKAHLEFPRNATLVAGNAINLPFTDQKFDLVYNNGLSVYLTEREQIRFYREVVRILQPGGSYFEVLGERDKAVPTSGKKLLGYLIGVMITNSPKGRPFSQIWNATFLKEEFELINHMVEVTSLEDIVQKARIPLFNFSQLPTAKKRVVEFRKRR